MSAIRSLRDSAGAGRALVFFPHAGGSANFYRGFVPPQRDVDVFAVQYPGRADRLREACHRDLTKLADDLAAELTALRGPSFTFVGHSMGAIVAFEVARLLEAAGLPPVTLVASAARAPHDPRHVVDRDVRWNEEKALRELVAMGQIDEELLADRRLSEIVLAYVRADYEMLQRYEYFAGPPLNGDVLAVTGADDPDVTAAHARLWEELTAGRFRHEEMPGGHFYLVPEPPVGLFLDAFPAQQKWGLG
jgi:surfactin synthase thioesterase subunit